MVPVPKLLPPLDAAYQFSVPALALAPSETVPLPQRLPGIVVLIVGVVFTVAKTAVLDPVVHPLLVAST